MASRIRLVLMLACTLLMTITPALAEAVDLFDGAPPVPPGYATHAEAREALKTGAVAKVEDRKEVPEGITLYDDVVYSSPGGTPLSLDLYVPENAKTPPPTLLFIHGGGWTAGKKEDFSLYCIAFAERGYATATMDYRLSPAYHFPNAIHDVKCAIVWLRTHEKDYGIDASRMAALGDSAGGHLSLLAGYSQDPALECPDAPEGVDTRLQAIVNLYGVVDCTVPVAQEARQVTDFIGKSYAEGAERYALASPIRHLDKSDPPTLTIHGTIDELVPIEQADTLHERLDELGIENYYDRIEGWPHSLDLAQPLFERCVYDTARFLEEHLPLKP